MQHEEKDYAYIWDMLQAARELIDMNHDVNFEAFLDDTKLIRATERSLEIIGEAARRLSPEFTSEHQEIEWHAMIGQRNIIAHEYGQIDYELLFRTVVDDIPVMTRQLEQMMPDVEDEL